MTSSNRIYLFDTTLRDGAQTQGVDFTVADKAAIARELDLLGIDYIEGGWPGANPTDDRFFADPPEFKNAKFVAFGMTRRAGRSAANDSRLVSDLMPSSRSKINGSPLRCGTSTGTTSSASRPASHASIARRCERSDHASWSARSRPSSRLTMSVPSPMW